MPSFTTEQLRKQALILANENIRAQPRIEKVYWFPDDGEVRLVEVEPDTIRSESGAVEPFYFDPSPNDGLPAPSGIAVIRPEEFRTLRLPKGWGSWDDAQQLELER